MRFNGGRFIYILIIIGQGTHMNAFKGPVRDKGQKGKRIYWDMAAGGMRVMRKL